MRVGIGRAFNLKYRPNGPIRFNCYHRQMPMPSLFGGDRYSYTENINIQRDSGGFWGFLSGLTDGFFGMTALMGGLFGGGIFGEGGIFGALNKKKQGASDSAEAGDEASLQGLNTLYGKFYNIISHPTKPGKFVAVSKDGSKEYTGTFEQLKDLLKVGGEVGEPKVNKDTDSTEILAEFKEARAAAKNLTKDANGVYKDANDKVYEWNGTLRDFVKKEEANGE
ncbi:hypothetical protein J6I39_06405 [bacterium]|nr:hypothetical protein [bacterium]